MGGEEAKRQGQEIELCGAVQSLWWEAGIPKDWLGRDMEGG